MALVRAEGHVGLQTVGCRRLALLALTGRKKCRAALTVGATQAVCDVLRAKSTENGHEVLWILQHDELRRLAINALLNLSIEPDNQRFLARYVVRVVLQLICEPALSSRPQERKMLARLLENLSTNDDNRRQLYKAELVLRTAQFHGIFAHSTGGASTVSTTSEASPKGSQTPRLPPIGGGGAQDGSLTARSDPGGRPADAIAGGKPTAAVESGVSRDGAGKASLKQQYVRWLGAVLDETESDEEEAHDVLERLHQGAPACVPSPRRQRGRDDAGGRPRIESSTGLLPRLLCRPMGSTWRQQLDGVHLAAEPHPTKHKHTPVPPLPGTGRQGAPPARGRRLRTDGDAAEGAARRGSTLAEAAAAEEADGGMRERGDTFELMASLLAGETDEEDNMANSHVDPWHPAIEKVEVRKNASVGPFVDSAKQRRAKSRKKERLAFTVRLDAAHGSEETGEPRCYRFNDGAAGEKSEKRRGSSMTVWKGIRGSRLWDGLGNSVPLGPKSKTVLHFYHATTPLCTVHPGAEPGEAEPTSFDDIQQPGLPAP
eukprot:6074416-Prymnesium_polylepis.1